MAHSINATQLSHNAYVYIRGNVEFSRLTRFLTEKELAADELRRQAKGMMPLNSNYLTVTISNAKIVPINPAQLSLEEQYIQETFYKSQKNPNVDTYSPVSKSNNFPKFFEPVVNADGSYDMTHYKELPISNEPANGLDITIIMRSFKPKKFNNVGFVIDGIIANEPMRYYDFNFAANDLKKRGITVDELTPAEREEALARLNQRMVTAPASADDSVMTATQPVITPASVGSDPYSTISNTPFDQFKLDEQLRTDSDSTVNATPTNEGASNPSMTSMNPPSLDTWTCPNCHAGGNTGKFCAQCATPKPEPISGIVFDANSTNRNY